MISDVYVAIPAWGEHFVDMATKYAIPSLLASHSLCPQWTLHFIVYTDQPNRFWNIDGYKNVYIRELRDVPLGAPFDALNRCHRALLDETPVDQAMVITNADVVVSREFFSYIYENLRDAITIIPVLGLRSLVEPEPPPIGATARDLLEWSWRNRHPITSDFVLNKGKSGLPTTVLFEQNGSVVGRSSHLCPIAVRKVKAFGKFAGTVDDGLMALFDGYEIKAPMDREFSIAELSPPEKTAPVINLLTVESANAFANNIGKHHARSFKLRWRLIGDGDVDDEADARAILGKKW